MRKIAEGIPWATCRQRVKKNWAPVRGHLVVHGLPSLPRVHVPKVHESLVPRNRVVVAAVTSDDVLSSNLAD